MSKISTSLETLRDLTDDDIRDRLTTSRDELFRMKLGKYTNQVTSAAGIQSRRRDIARLMTVLRGRKLGNEQQAQKSKASAAEGTK
jgi:large subunit ribosomal protein L29